MDHHRAPIITAPCLCQRQFYRANSNPFKRDKLQNIGNSIWFPYLLSITNFNPITQKGYDCKGLCIFLYDLISLG